MRRHIRKLGGILLALVMVLSLLPAEPFHVHAAETESAKTTKKVTDEDTRLEIDYDKPFYKVDADGNPVYDKNGQLIYLEPEQALAEEAESHRSSVSTYSSGQPMDHDYYWSYDNRDPWRQIYKGDKEELRAWMESKDPDDGRIVLIEDIKITLDGNDSWEPIKITRDKVLDLNGKTIERTTGKEEDTTGRLISVHNPECYLAIMDYSETKTGTIKNFGDVGALGGLGGTRQRRGRARGCAGRVGPDPEGDGDGGHCSASSSARCAHRANVSASSRSDSYRRTTRST